jgi:Secretion system C-terminal sorting domain
MKNSIKILFTLSLVLPLFLKGQHTNIIIDNGGSADEPAICLDINKPNRVVAGSNISNIYYSEDTGRTWKRKLQTSSFGVWGDPVIVNDNKGDFYHFHLSNPAFGNWIDRIVCQKSTDGGKTWNDGSFTGLNGEKNQDKHWLTIDRKTNALYCTWTQFDKYESRAPGDSSTIQFSKSTDGGLTWSPAKRINTFSGDCLDDDNTVEGAVPSIGTNGEVYVSWAGPKGLSFQKSLDGGNTWLPQEQKITDIGGGWSYAIPGIYRCNGLPITLCDTSNSAFRGTIYVNWSDQKNGESNTDVWLVKSKDGGKTWSIPRKVNNDTGNQHQFMTWMTIDQSNGNLWSVFYDRRNYTSDSTDVYMALSRDGGETFTNFKISEKPFKPLESVFFGDYTNVTAHNNIVRPIWTSMNNTGRKTIYTALVDVASISTAIEGVSMVKELTKTLCYPNPVKGQMNIVFELKSSAKLCLKIFNESGKEVATIFDKKKFDNGKHDIPIDLSAYHLTPGVYTYIIKNKKGRDWATNRFVVME